MEQILNITAQLSLSDIAPEMPELERIPEIKQEEIRCIKPSFVVRELIETVAQMFGSHDWKVFDSKPFGTKGVLIAFKCTRCDADGMATLNDDR
jgi:hypothetical protein